MTASRGLLVDYGGVLTPPLGPVWRDVERRMGLEKGTVFRTLQSAYEPGTGAGDIERLERGELDLATFEAGLADRLREVGGAIPEEGLVASLFHGMVPAGGVWEMLRRARAGGVRTGLLSNSWGTDAYPRDLLAEVCDEVVISAEVGVRKPDPAIFHLAAERLGVPPEGCAFVDDLPRNVEVATSLGMFGVHHTGDDAATAAALSAFLGVDLTADAA
ncbi:MAG: HAD family hydrolase [Actinomycetes bacterium]